MSWQLLMLLQNMFASVYALQSRQLATRYHAAHFQILAVVFIFVYIVFLGYALMNSGEIAPQAAADYAGQLAVTGILFTVWTVLTFITFRFVDAAIGIIFSTLNLIAVVLAASFIIHESLTILQLVGAALLVTSIVVIGLAHQAKKKKRNWFIGLLLTIIASICFGAAMTSEKYLLDRIGAPTYAVFGIGAQMLPLVILALCYRRKEFRLFKKKEFRNKVVAMGLVRGMAGLLFIVSLVIVNNLSLVGMLSGLKVVMTAILAAIILKELMFIRRKLLAAFISLVGAGLILW